MNIVSLLFTCIILFSYSSHSLEITSPPELVGESIDWINAVFSGPITPTGVEGILAFARTDGCSPFSDSLYDTYHGKFIMVVRGGCTLSDKAVNVARIGGIATIIANDASGELAPGGRVTAPHPVVGISGVSASRLRALNVTTNGTLHMKIYQNPTVQDHKQALLDFYTNTNGPQWRASGGNIPLGWLLAEASDPCQAPWEGITCNPDGTVRSIILDRLNIQGSIPPSFSVLTPSIQRIVITNNYMTGPIPAYFSTFTKLMKLQLSQNEMTGELFPNWENLPLESIQLDRNMFSGTIPISIFTIQPLKTLALASNRFEGTIDPSISQLRNLTILDLKSNSLSGPYPSIFNRAFVIFNIADNHFSGPVPTTIATMRLETFDISHNEFDFFPPYAVASMDAMRFLDISHNKFIGAVPVPGPKTRFFIASNNMFSSITSELRFCYFMALLDLSSNLLAGQYTNLLGLLPVPIAQEVSDNQCLQYIDFSHNLITGTSAGIFELGLDKWPLLVEFSFRNNTISSELSLLATNLIYLRVIDISQNDLTGVIPQIVTSLPRLTTFNISHTSMRYRHSYLPDNVYTDLSTSTYVEGGNMSCPKILTLSGAEIIVDNEYHDFELCSCEPGYRRRANHTNPLVNATFDCLPCPEGLECPGRLNDTKFIFVKQFYPSPTAEDPIALIPCASCMPESGEVFQCKQHHSGRMCSSCDKDYFWSGNSCDKCIPVGSTLIVCSIIILALIILTYGFYSLFLRGLLCVPQAFVPTTEELEMQDVKADKSQKVFIDRRMEAYETEKANAIDGDLRSIAAVSIAINYYQTVSALSQYFSLPNSIISLMATSRILSSASGAGVSLACISPHLGDFSNLYTAVMLEPVIVIGAVAFVYILGRIAIFIARVGFKKQTPMLFKQWNITCMTMLLFGLNFLFFPVSSNAINAFRCTEDPATTIKYNSAYPFALCNSVDLGSRILALILFSGGILVIFSTLILCYNRSKPGTRVYTVIGNSFGFIFLHYRKKYTFFAIVVLFRRFILSLLISIIRVHSVLSFGLITAILVLSISLNHLIQPFRTIRDNHLETITLVATFFAYALAFTLSIDELDYGSAPVVVFYFVVNVGIILWCAYEFIAGQLPRVHAVLEYLNCSSKSRVASDSPRKATNNFNNKNNDNDNYNNDNENNNNKVNNDIREEDLDEKTSVTVSLSNVKAESLKNSTASSNPDDDLDSSRSDVPMIGSTNHNN